MSRSKHTELHTSLRSVKSVELWASSICWETGTFPFTLNSTKKKSILKLNRVVWVIERETIFLKCKNNIFIRWAKIFTVLRKKKDLSNTHFITYCTEWGIRHKRIGQWLKQFMSWNCRSQRSDLQFSSLLLDPWFYVQDRSKLDLINSSTKLVEVLFSWSIWLRFKIM